MKIMLFILIALVSKVSLANHCTCELYAASPLTASHAKIEDFLLEKKQGKFYGYVNAKSAQTCAQECTKILKDEFEVDEIQAKLNNWTVELIKQGLVGKSCAVDTDLKIPIKGSAKIGEYSLGIVSSRMMFVHHPTSCFN